jgi:hypothetical protein
VLPFVVLEDGTLLNANRAMPFGCPSEGRVSTVESGAPRPAIDAAQWQRQLRGIIESIHTNSSLLIWAPLLEVARRNGMELIPDELDAAPFEIRFDEAPRPS